MSSTSMPVSSAFESLLYKALRIRRVEERIIDLYPSDKIQSPVHLSIGQEFVAVSVCAPLRANDLMFANYRSHAYYLAKGGCLKKFFAELYGRSGGVSGGKAGSMHLCAPDVGFMGSSAVVASNIPHAVGAALAAKQNGRNEVVVAILGDGATEEGVYHECLNMAALWTLPLLLICEDNGLAVHTPLKDRQSYGIVDHAKGYGLDVYDFENGNDLDGLSSLCQESCHRIRLGGGPSFIRVGLYRYMEHVGPGRDFDAGYRSLEELAPWLKQDPIEQFPPLVDRMEDDIRREIDEAIEFAEASAVPGPADLLTHV